MLLDCLKQAEVGQRMLLAWVSFLALPTRLPSEVCSMGTSEAHAATERPYTEESRASGPGGVSLFGFD